MGRAWPPPADIGGPHGAAEGQNSLLASLVKEEDRRKKNRKERREERKKYYSDFMYMPFP
jgi:hypothetical protein